MVPETSTTLLRDLASDARHVRWTEFVRRYRPMMEDYLRLHFPGLEPDDIVSETLVALVDALANYRYAPDETGHFRNYLTGVLKHKALHRRRHAARQAVRDMEYLAHVALAEDSHAEAERREWQEAVFAVAVGRLLEDPEIQERTRQVFIRVALNHEPPESVAESLGMTRNAVDQIKNRMVARLRGIVQMLRDVV